MSDNDQKNEACVIAETNEFADEITSLTSNRSVDAVSNSIFAKAMASGPPVPQEQICKNECGTEACKSRCKDAGGEFTTSFQDVCTMNIAFGNLPMEGEFDWDKLENQVKMAGEELQESIDDGTNIKDITGFVDGLADTLVFTYGAFHYVGIDADQIMRIVFDANMSKFIKDDTDMMATIKKYADIGVIVQPHGNYPMAYVKTPDMEQTDKNGKVYKPNKFLKGVRFEAPEEKIAELIKKSLSADK